LECPFYIGKGIFYWGALGKFNEIYTFSLRTVNPLGNNSTLDEGQFGQSFVKANDLHIYSYVLQRGQLGLIGLSRGFMVIKNLFSNTLLGLGILLLVTFAVLEMWGLRSDPLLPAFSAFFIGCTAVLDRMGDRQLKQTAK